MPRFAANLTMMFNEVPFLDRFRAASSAGFQAVEFLFPFEHSPHEIAERLTEYRLHNVLFNMPPGNWSAGERGLTSLPGREAEFAAGVEKSLMYAEALGTPAIHAMAGLIPKGGSPEEYRATYIRNLKYAAEKLAQRNKILLIEPINTRDIPGYFLNRQDQAHAIREEVGADNLKVQMDLYHAQIVEGDLAVKLRRYVAHIGHIQAAGVPERNEPNTGEINYEYIFGLLDELGYPGWIGCEYRPAEGTLAGLSWFKPYLRESSRAV